jgi:hypothetical protein
VTPKALLARKAPLPSRGTAWAMSQENMEIAAPTTPRLAVTPQPYAPSTTRRSGGLGGGRGKPEADEPSPLGASSDARSSRDDRFFPAELPAWSPGNAWASPRMRSNAAAPRSSAARKNLPTDSRRVERSGRSQPASGFAREQQHQLPLRGPNPFLRGQVRCWPTARGGGVRN